MEVRSMISFDWAMKRLLRQKANFEVLEGFLSELLRRKIIIKYIGESEGNQADADDKWNKVDMLVEADGKELVIIELQYDSESDYFQRMHYGVSKAITEYMHIGEPYSSVRKVYSINIVYFDLGKGDDYVYHGITSFTGLHTHAELQLTDIQQRLYGKTVPGELLPEYYILKIRNFDDIAKNTLDEWIYYLKNNKIPDDFTAQGIKRARQILAYDKLSESERKQYWRQIENRRVKDSVMSTSFIEGEAKGEIKGIAKGLAKGLAKGIAKGLAKGKAERDQLKAESEQLKATLSEKEEKEAKLIARIAELEKKTSEK
ncbi:MAG: Rpn family recombination-promoting nuclease/putative transposase [Tannerella sp.]|jgi:predicted transposase/invertase (TIGR01784 family)|nr:Rpn family recombination-promoting nuclease/putative transposase [Tannerella sp.]